MGVSAVQTRGMGLLMRPGSEGEGREKKGSADRLLDGFRYLGLFVIRATIV